MVKKLMFVALGVIFGVALSRSGATDYDLMHSMFTGKDPRIALLIGTAIVVGFLGMKVLSFAGGKTISGEPIALSRKPLTRVTAAGGALFGVGWGLTGACPGTVLAMLGEGKLLALVLIAGIVAGTYVFGISVSGKDSGERRWR